MKHTDAFPKKLIVKLNAASEARAGKGIYKRANGRDYRVILHLNTYKDLCANNPNFLDKFSRGYAVRIKPNEYFDNDGNKKNDFPQSLELGDNAFIYFKDIKDWKKYKNFCKDADGTDWQEVIELHTQHKTVPVNEQWIGKYCKYINNAKPHEVSLICGKKTNETQLQELKDKLSVATLPKQNGLGNFDYDYASKEEIKNIKYQLSYLMWQVEGMKDYILNFFHTSNADELSAEQRHHKDNNTLAAFVDDVIAHITNFCKDKNLEDLNTLANIGAWDNQSKRTICPLCKKPLLPEEFFNKASQASGREEEDNTQTEIALMHIEGLKSGKLNHRTYNLGWGHRRCNTIQGEYSIDETISYIREVLNGYNSST